jgi:hypothetical protein
MGINFGDARSFKMTVVADDFVNPQNYPMLPQTRMVYDQLRDSGYRIIRMPHPAMIGKGLEGWVVSTVDQIQEYSNRGFRILVLGTDGISGKGIWMTNLKRETRKRGLTFPKSIVLKRSELQSQDVVKTFLK